MLFPHFRLPPREGLLCRNVTPFPHGSSLVSCTFPGLHANQDVDPPVPSLSHSPSSSPFPPTPEVSLSPPLDLPTYVSDIQSRSTGFLGNTHNHPTQVERRECGGRVGQNYHRVIRDCRYYHHCSYIINMGRKDGVVGSGTSTRGSGSCSVGTVWTPILHPPPSFPDASPDLRVQDPKIPTCSRVRISVGPGTTLRID